MANLSQRVRLRLRDELRVRKMSQQDLADLIGWTQSKVAQKINGRTDITLDDLEALCFGLSLMPSEAVRDHGLEFCAELTPLELRVLERWRRFTPAEQDAFRLVMEIPRASGTPDRYAKLPKKAAPVGRSRTDDATRMR